MGTKEASARALSVLVTTRSWAYQETPYTDVRDGHITANGGGRAGRIVAHIPQTEDGETIIELRDALRALLESL